MNGETMQILCAMIGYMLIVILIGVFFAKRSQANSENYFLGGRSLGPWVAAMSAEASDMSGWLLMGLPGVAYWCGIADAAWTAIGLAVGTYINWLCVSKRLRAYSAVSGDAITVPDFLSNRFREKKKVILGISATFILIFFTVYAASCFVTCGKLFAGLFGYDYHVMMIVGAGVCHCLYLPWRLSCRECVGFHAGGGYDYRACERARHRCFECRRLRRSH